MEKCEYKAQYVSNVLTAAVITNLARYQSFFWTLLLCSRKSEKEKEEESQF